MRAGIARLVLALGLVAVGAGTWLAGGALERMEDARPAEEELLYLPNGRLLKVLSLGHANLIADAVYLWAIQYYSNYERADRYRYVEHVFGQVITELDPHYIDAYWLGGLILSIEAHDLDAAVNLLQKGAERNPDKWILPYVAAWECYHAGQFERAAKFFEQASRVPRAPVVIRRMRAGMLSKAGGVEEAMDLWRELLDDPESDSATRAVAERKLRELHVARDTRILTDLLARFRSDNGRYPRRLEELVSRDYIRSLPRAPEGQDYPYDSRTGKVGAAAGRLLGSN